ncbi:hypothetical protein BE18_11330, partial [Sorangium cellulosum]
MSDTAGSSSGGVPPPSSSGVVTSIQTIDETSEPVPAVFWKTSSVRSRSPFATARPVAVRDGEAAERLAQVLLARAERARRAGAEQGVAVVEVDAHGARAAVDRPGLDVDDDL